MVASSSASPPTILFWDLTPDPNQKITHKIKHIMYGKQAETGWFNMANQFHITPMSNIYYLTRLGSVFIHECLVLFCTVNMDNHKYSNYENGKPIVHIRECLVLFCIVNIVSWSIMKMLNQYGKWKCSSHISQKPFENGWIIGLPFSNGAFSSRLNVWKIIKTCYISLPHRFLNGKLITWNQ